MPRQSDGQYNLPDGNPVASGSPIASTWANNTFSDVANSITDSLDRQGRGAMLAPLKVVNGSDSLPSLTFTSELTSGLYWAGLNDIRMSLKSVDLFRWYDNNIDARVVQINTDTGFKNVLYEGSSDTLPPASADEELLVWNDTGQIWEAGFSAGINVSYDNNFSGLSALDVQAAIDEVASVTAGEQIPAGTIDAQTLLWSVSLTAWVAVFNESINVIYDPTASGLSATNAQAAIDEVDAALDAHVSDTEIHMKQEVVEVLPGTTDPNTIYYVTGP
jgi:hypothetical protein